MGWGGILILTCHLHIVPVCHTKPLGPDQNRSSKVTFKKASSLAQWISDFLCSTHLFVVSLDVLLKQTIICCLFLHPCGWHLIGLAKAYQPAMSQWWWSRLVTWQGLAGSSGRATTHPVSRETIPAYAYCLGIIFLSEVPWFKLYRWCPYL